MSNIPDFASASYPEIKAGAPATASGTETWMTNEQIPVPPTYSESVYDDCLHLDFTAGVAPNLRGPYATMYVARPWTVRQYAGFSTAEESNAFYRRNLAAGQKGLSIAFDLATHRGYDSDHPRVVGDVGKAGVAVDSILDMEILFKGIPLDKMSVSMTMNGAVLPVLAFYIVAAQEQGCTLDQLSGTIQNDILKEYMVRNTYIYPPDPSMKIIADIFEFTSKYMPKFNSISISGYHIREAGSTAAQEIAFTLADGIAYVEAALEAGMDIDEFAGRLSFFFNAHNNLLEEVAKYRAARRLWAKIMKERFHAKKDRSMMLRFHTQTGGSTLTAQQPDNNIVRVAIQTLAAVLGGTQSLHTNSRDEALALPTEDSVRIALRTQQIVAYESGVADSIDPLGGSYYVERMTDELQAAAEAYIEKIDAMGGAVKAIEQGYIQREIAESSYQYQRQVESGEQIVVGVNKFTIEEPPAKGLLHIDASVAANQIKKLQEMKAARDNVLVRQRLDALRTAAEGSDNLMPYILDCARVYCTEGEICGELRKVFGEYRPMEVL